MSHSARRAYVSRLYYGVAFLVGRVVCYLFGGACAVYTSPDPTLRAARPIVASAASQWIKIRIYCTPAVNTFSVELKHSVSEIKLSLRGGIRCR